MKRCPRCGAEHERSHAYCSTCWATYMRTWRARRTRELHELRAAEREREVAQALR